MSDIMTELFIVFMYLGTIMGIVLFLAFVCRVGDLGFYFLGWIDQKLQERVPAKVVVKKEEFPFAYGQPGVAKSSHT